MSAQAQDLNKLKVVGENEALEPCLEQPQIFQIFQKLGWRGEGEIP